jgi:hypothetical protein
VEFFGPPGARVLDPACGWGRILRAAKDAGYTPIGSDIVDRLQLGHVAFSIRDFLKRPPVRSVTSVVCNPPFDQVEEFCRRALEIATLKVAMICPVRRLPAAHWLERVPLVAVYLMTPRPSMPPGSWIAAGNKPGGGTIDFVWLVFNKKIQRAAAPPLAAPRQRAQDGGRRHEAACRSFARDTADHRGGIARALARNYPSEERFPSLAGQGAIRFDCETFNPDLKTRVPGPHRDGFIAGIAVRTEAGYRNYFPIAHEAGPNPPRGTVLAWLRRELQSDAPKIGANLIYDLAFLSAADVNVRQPFYDVQVAEPLFDETRLSYSLGNLAQHYLGQGKVEDRLETWIIEHFGKKNPKANVWRARRALCVWEPANGPASKLAQVRPRFKSTNIANRARRS